MFIEDVIVQSNQQIAFNTFLIKVKSQVSLQNILPGQFFNIKVNNSSFPLLRRPFSVSDIKGNSIFFMYKVVGEGTSIISQKKVGEKINLLGPLGNSFIQDDSFNHAILIGGGIGIAPFPYLKRQIEKYKSYSVLFGLRTKEEAHSFGLDNIEYSSDDGSIGYKGNVVELLDFHLSRIKEKNVKIFGCGPNPMLRALQKYAIDKHLNCEVSMESAMACGFGICQGCPIENSESDAYKLICKDGPVFNISDITI